MSTVPLPPKSNTPLPQDGGPSFGLRNRLVRLVWGVVWLLLASWTPRQLQPWRRALLQLFGARMGHKADVRGSSRVWLPSHLVMADHAVIGPNVTCYNQAPITLGERALVSQGAHLCAGTHDIDDAHFQLVAKPIFIGAHAWVAAEAFVGPGAQLAEGVVLGARAVLFGRTEPWGVYAGNPAKFVRGRRWRPGTIA
jgi:putative colanic acid biosynthesis acetyltransferase WcaF